MKGDFSRDTFSSRKHYSAVLMQQGRVQIDADWNEQRAIDRRRIETEARDLIGAGGEAGVEIGPGGAPAGNAGFEIGVHEGETLSIGSGNLYVDGVLCQNEETILFEEQPDLPVTKAIDSLPGDLEVGLVCLDVWERHITGLEDETIREVALGGPDTATRSKTVWQAKVLPIRADTSNVPALQPLLEEHVGIASRLEDASGTEAAGLRADLARTDGRILDLLKVDRDGPFEFESRLPAVQPPSTGRLSARALPSASAESPCVVAPDAGYERLENQLYRVEIHDGGERGQATFKWSRDNGSVTTAVLEVSSRGTGAEISVRDLGRDETLGFENGQVVELLDDGAELAGQAGRLMQILTNPTTRTITVNDTPPEVNARDAHDFHWKLRRWDSPGAVPIPAEEGAFVELEGGIQVRFTGGRYNTGDYWLIPARTATGEIEWPDDRAELPAGVNHRYARLALVMAATVADDRQPPVESRETSERAVPVQRGRRLLVLADCRRLYPAVTELTSLFYLGGDGQEAGSGQQLPRPLAVGVANGDRPVVGARVRFDVQTRGSESYDGHLEADGGTGTSVKATTDARGEARCVWTLATGQASQQVRATLLDGAHLGVYFNANLSAAGETVAESIQVKQLLIGQPGAQEQELRLDGVVPVNALADGIRVVCDQNSVIDEQTVVGKPTCFVTVNTPFPHTPADRAVWGDPPLTGFVGFQPLILAAQVSAAGNRIAWTPTQDTRTWLLNRLFQAVPAVPTELTAFLTLKGNFIWDKTRPQAYLDGDVFGVRRPGGGGIELQLPSGDGRRGGDFEMWFRLVAQALVLDSVTLSRSEVVGGTQVTTTGTVRLIGGTAPGAGTKITLESDDPSVTVPADVTIQAGRSSADFPVTTQAVGARKTVTIKAKLGAAERTASLVVQPPTLLPVTLNPGAIIGKTGVVQGTVTLNGPAPTGGISVALSSNSANAKLRQSSVSVPPGSSSVGFQVDTEPVGSVLAATITATQTVQQTTVQQTATLTIQPPTVSGLSLNPTSIRGESTSTGTLTISGPAPANFTVTLESLDTFRATVQGEVTVQAGSSSVTFPVNARPVSFDGAVTIRATRSGVQSTAPLMVLASGLAGFTFDTNPVNGGAQSTGRITLNGPAPFNTFITLSPTDNPAATFPGSISVPPGGPPGGFQVTFAATGRSFTGTTNRSVTVTAAYLGSTASATLAVWPTKGKDTKEKELKELRAAKEIAIAKEIENPIFLGRSGLAGPETAEGGGEPGGEDPATGRAFVQPAERAVTGQQALDRPPAEE